MKNLISFIIAFVISAIIVVVFLKLFFVALSFAFDIIKYMIFLVPIVLLSLPLFVIIKKKILN